MYQRTFLHFTHVHVSVDNLCTLQNFDAKVGFPLNNTFKSLRLSVSIIIKNISFLACPSG